MTDPIGDLLTRIRNAYKARHRSVSAPYSKVKHALVTLLVQLRYLEGVEVDTKARILTVMLRYENGKPALTTITRISKPGLRRYVSAKTIPIVVGGMGAVILSTPQGIMTGKEASKKHLGGELICKIW